MLSFKVIKLNIFQSYFLGEVEFCSDKYKVNIQRRGKVLKLPFEIKLKSEKNLVWMICPGNLVVEDYPPIQRRIRMT